MGVTLLLPDMCEGKALARWAGLWSEGSTPGWNRFNVIGSFIRIFTLVKLLKVLIEGLASMAGLGDTEVAVSSTGVWGPCCGLGGVLGQ